jgi:hypothetical protein
MITETSAKDSMQIKQRWLQTSVEAVRELRAGGVPVLGYTWFPLLTMVDWRYRTGSRPLHKYLIELGLYESKLNGDGSFDHVPTPLVKQFHALSLAPEQAVGDLRISR